MKVYVVVDLDYDGGLIGVYEDKAAAEAIAKEKYFNNPKVIDRYEYRVYARELIVTHKGRET